MNDRQQTLLARAQAVTPGGVHSPVRDLRSVGGKPLFVNCARGAELITADKRRLIDFCLAFGPLIHGHADKTIGRAVSDALARGWSYGTAESTSLELAELICGRLAWVEQIRFMNSGTEAVMTALRIARAATGRHKILKFSGCYHGHSDAMLIKAGSGLAGVGEANSAGITPGITTDTLVADLDDREGLAKLFTSHGKQLAAAIIEPLPANHGLLPQRLEFLHALQAHCHRHGSLLILDEVITGFRVAFGGCAQLYDLQPDLVTYGKIIGGGFPVGAVAGSKRLMQQLAPLGDVYQAGTLSANPVAMTAGLATLQALSDGEAYQQLEELGRELDRGLQNNLSVHLERQASIFWIAPQVNSKQTLRRPQDIPDQTARSYSALFQSALAEGLYLPPSPYEVGFLCLAHDENQIRKLTNHVNAFTSLDSS